MPLRELRYARWLKMLPIEKMFNFTNRAVARVHLKNLVNLKINKKNIKQK
jgi:hypothetical protein